MSSPGAGAQRLPAPPVPDPPLELPPVAVPPVPEPPVPVEVVVEVPVVVLVMLVPDETELPPCALPVVVADPPVPVVLLSSLLQATSTRAIRAMELDPIRIFIFASRRAAREGSKGSYDSIRAGLPAKALPALGKGGSEKP